MRPLFDHLKIFNTHCCGIRKVPRCFREKPAKNKKVGVNLSNTGVHSGNFIQNILEGGEIINYRVRSGIFLKKPLGGNHLHFVKKWHLGHPRLP